MREFGVDFFGRLRSFIDIFGIGGLLIVIIAAIIVTVIALWRGTGFVLLILFLSFSMGAISQRGIIFMATLVRWGCLALLGVGIFKRPRFYGRGILFFAFYVFLGAVFIFLSPMILWTTQQTFLLAMTVFGISVAVNSYAVSCKHIDNLFKMGITAAAVWTITSMLFVSEYLYSTRARFSTSEEIGGVAVAYAGVFFAPMVFWGVIQNRYKLWRILSILLYVPFIFIVMLGGVRSAMLGMLVIACLPLLFFKVRLIKLILLGSILVILIVAAVSLLFVMVPDKAQYLVERIFTISTTGRFELWVTALGLCMKSGFIGHGIGSSDAAIFELNMYFHNAYLIIWYNAGLLGLLSILLFFANYLWKSFRLVLTSGIPELSEYSRLGLGYMLGIMAMGMFEGVFATASGIGLVMLIIVSNLIDQIRHLSLIETFGQGSEQITIDDETGYPVVSY